MAEGPRTRNARSLEQWPQLNALGATFCHGAGGKAGRLTVERGVEKARKQSERLSQLGGLRAGRP
jgi:hypothetical protein